MFVSGLLVVVVLVFGLVNFGKSFAGGATYVIENVENWYGAKEDVEEEDATLGIIEFPDGIPYSQLASNVLKERVIEVGVSQIASLSHDPVELLPNPGSGFTYDIEKIIGYRKFASESWTFRSNVTDDQGFEVKWEDNVTAPASGLANAFALGASFSKGFVDGGAENTTASPAFQIWVPSRKAVIGGASIFDGTASSTYQGVYTGSSSAVYLTASATFNNTTFTGVTNGDLGTKFFFRIIYRLVNLNF